MLVTSAFASAVQLGHPLLPRRHIFENKKYVEDFRMDDIQRELGLDRDGLIYMALLLGSDYTEGVAGIGVVNALEVSVTCCQE